MGKSCLRTARGRRSTCASSTPSTGPPTSLERPREENCTRRERPPRSSPVNFRSVGLDDSRGFFFTHIHTYIYIYRERERVRVVMLLLL